MTPKDPGKLTDHISLGTLTRIVPRYIVDEVLTETNRREQRSRTLPAHLVVYFVLALSLFTDGYEEVIRKLVNAPTLRPGMEQAVDGADHRRAVACPHPPRRGAAAGPLRGGGTAAGDTRNAGCVARPVAGDGHRRR